MLICWTAVYRQVDQYSECTVQCGVQSQWRLQTRDSTQQGRRTKSASCVVLQFGCLGWPCLTCAPPPSPPPDNSGGWEERERYPVLSSSWVWWWYWSLCGLWWGDAPPGPGLYPPLAVWLCNCWNNNLLNSGPATSSTVWDTIPARFQQMFFTNLDQNRSVKTRLQLRKKEVRVSWRLSHPVLRVSMEMEILGFSDL